MADQVCYALTAGAIEAPLVMLAFDGFSVEARHIFQGHVCMWASPSICLEFSACWPNQQHALFASLKESHPSFGYIIPMTDNGERHRNRPQFKVIVVEEQATHGPWTAEKEKERVDALNLAQSPRSAMGELVRSVGRGLG
jgi:hypothetical protein